MAVTTISGWDAVSPRSCAPSAGAVTAMFSFVNGLLLRPLPYPNAERLASVVGPGMIRPADLDLWREGARSIERFEGFSATSELLDEPGDVRRLRLFAVTENYLPMLGARPIRGRLWAADEAGSADPRVIVISERIWVEVLRGADLSNRTLALDGIAHVVIGVLPDEFHNGGYTSTDAWVPLVVSR